MSSNRPSEAHDELGTLYAIVPPANESQYTTLATELSAHAQALDKIDHLARECERWRIRGERIRGELIDWLIGDLSPSDAGLINGRRIVDEIDRICPKE